MSWFYIDEGKLPAADSYSFSCQLVGQHHKKNDQKNDQKKSGSRKELIYSLITLRVAYKLSLIENRFLSLIEFHFELRLD